MYLQYKTKKESVAIEKESIYYCSVQMRVISVPVVVELQNKNTYIYKQQNNRPYEKGLKEQYKITFLLLFEE